MKNVKLSLEGDTLTITINLKEYHGVSASGKSTIIATTEGNIPLRKNVDDEEPIYLGLNLYRSRY